MKSIFDKNVAYELNGRIKKLQPGSKASWGTMNAAEMLLHCYLVTDTILKQAAITKPSTAKQKILKYLFLNVIKKLPKNITAPKKLNVRLNNIQPLSLEEEKQRTISLIEQFANHQKEINLPHPRFGMMNTAEWGRFVYMHFDHHLRQFSV